MPRSFLVRIWMVGFIACSFMMSGCTKKDELNGDPKARLSEYISKSFAVKSKDDRKELVNYLSGQAKIRLIAWSDEQFEQAFIGSKRQFVKLAWKEVKSVSPTEANITYELTYTDQSKGQDAKVTDKKLCQMVQQNGVWLIADVKNIKQLIEYKNEMSLP